MVNSRLLEILACPKDKGNLFYVADEEMLYNPRLQMRYEVRQGNHLLVVADVHGLLKRRQW
ncbi:MAG: Trm112 family protein, partial [Ilumatobacteraceae bacterium]